MLNLYKLKKSNVKNNISIKDKGILVKEPKYNPAFSREWYNSVYTFNKNIMKYLPSNDVYASKLIRIHFNLFSKKLENKNDLYSTSVVNRLRKVNRIFIAKPEFKHTNDKVIITLYVYNQELLSYMKKMHMIEEGLEFLNIFNTKSTINKENNINKDKLHIIKNIYTTFIKEINNLNIKYLKKTNYEFFNLEKFSLLELIKKMLIKLKLYLNIKKIIHVNKSKFNSIHIFYLRNLLRKVYGKNVEFNIVNLKNYNLNSSILNQILAVKISSRKVRPLSLMDMVLSSIRLPYKKLIGIPLKTPKRLNKQNLIIRNNLSNNYMKKIPFVELSNNINSTSNINTSNNIINLSKCTLNKIYFKKVNDDKLNSYLKSLYPKQYLINLSREEELYIKSRNLENTVLDKINNKVINGIRVEAAGRLTRRVSGRTITSIRQIGSTRNVYSSYKGISSVLLRGSLNYNVDYIKSDNKTRLGHFGLKGWISSI